MSIKIKNKTGQKNEIFLKKRRTVNTKGVYALIFSKFHTLFFSKLL